MSDKGYEAASGEPVKQRPQGKKPPPPKPPSLLKIIYNRALKQLSSLPLAIGELLLLAGLSSVGTFIEQNQSLAYYAEMYPNTGAKVIGFLTSDFILALQFDRIYTANYFLALMALLAASLAACTTTRQIPLVRVARRWRFHDKPERVWAQGTAAVMPGADVHDLGRELKSKGYQVFINPEGSLYSFKGLVGRLGPIGVHASMLAILGGVAFGGISGYKGSVMIPQGNEFLVASALRPVSPLASPPRGASDVIHVNSFDIKYREDGSEEQFFSNLSVLDGTTGAEVSRQIISVNKPLRWGGVTMYQTDWSMAAITLHATGSPMQPADGNSFNLPMASLEGNPGISGRIWGTFLPSEAAPSEDKAPRGVSILARDLQSVVFYDSKGTFMGVRRPDSGKPIEVEGMSIVIDGLVGSTGMEMKVDPGVPYVYAGFGGLMITTLVSYLSHSQIWAVQKEGKLHVGGRTNRATLLFKDELRDMLMAVPRTDPSAAPSSEQPGSS